MLKLPASADYGLLAAVHLTEAYASGRLAKASEVAEQRGIPLAYLERLLAQLKAAGLVESFRGPTGGHRLAREPARISALEVLAALTGPFSRPGGGGLDFLWSRCETAFAGALEVSLAEVAAEVSRSEEAGTYQI